ncbi:MAG: DUF6049 family protein [Actinobacteria bacterium]|nr:DUF6049 family protein [Actinomycetota bacterium]
MPPRPRRRRPGLGLLLGLLLAALLLPVTAPTASAVEGLTVTLTGVTPMVAGPDDPVTLTAQVHNRGPGPVTGAVLNVLRGGVRLTDQDSVSAWSADRSAATGRLLATAPVPDLAPRANAVVTATIPRGADASTRAYEVVPVSLEVGPVVTHTFVGVQRAKEYEPLSLAWLVPLTLDPDPELYAAPTPQRWARWRDVVGPDGRIGRILTALENVPVTYAVDAGLLLPSPPGGASTTTGAATPSPALGAATPATPVATPSGTPAPTPPDAGGPEDAVLPSVDDLAELDPLTAEARVRTAAAAWLRGRLAGRPVTLFPAGDPDLTAVGTGPAATTALREAGTTAGLAADLVGARRDIAWPADATWSSEVGQQVRTAVGGEATIVTDRAALATRLDQAGAGRRATDGTPLLARDAALSTAAAAATTSTPGSAGTAAGAQEFLAQSYALLQESPGVARTVLVAPDRGFDPGPEPTRALFAALAQIPWLQSTTVADEVTQAASAERLAEAKAGGTTTSPPSPLDATTRQQLDALAAQAASAASIRVDKALIGTDWTARLAALQGVRWRGHVEGFGAVRDELSAEVMASTRGVSVVPQTINFFADSGRVQVTVLNGLDVGVEDVRVQLVPENSRLRIEDATKSVTIGARSRATVTYRVNALAAGPVTITAKVTGPDGSPAGPATRVDVRVSPTGAATYWVLGAVTALVFALGLWRNQRARRRRAEPDQTNAIHVGEDGLVVEEPYGDEPRVETGEDTDDQEAPRRD